MYLSCLITEILSVSVSSVKTGYRKPCHFTFTSKRLQFFICKTIFRRCSTLQFKCLISVKFMRHPLFVQAKSILFQIETWTEIVSQPFWKDFYLWKAAHISLVKSLYIRTTELHTFYRFHRLQNPWGFLHDHMTTPSFLYAQPSIIVLTMDSSIYENDRIIRLRNF